MRTRQYILEAAEQMLQTKGLARLTNKEIAEAAGCAEGTLYNHFETKEALILAAIEENVPDFLTAIGEDRIGKGSCATSLKRMASRFASQCPGGTARPFSSLSKDTCSIPGRSSAGVEKKRSTSPRSS